VAGGAGKKARAAIWYRWMAPELGAFGRSCMRGGVWPEARARWSMDGCA
jgi:hypothetical protein